MKFQTTWVIKVDYLVGVLMYVIHNGIPYYCGNPNVVDVLKSNINIHNIIKHGIIIRELDSYKNDERYIKLLVYIRKLDSILYQELIK